MKRSTFQHIWMLPLLLCLLTFFGLLAALLSVGVWHWLASLTIGLPLAVIVYRLLAQPNTDKKS